MSLTVGLQAFLVLGVLLFALGFYCVLTRRNAVGLLMGVELILNSANVNFIAFSKYVKGGISGQVFSVFIIVLAAAEAAVALAIVLAVYKNFQSIDVEKTNLLKQ